MQYVGFILTSPVIQSDKRNGGRLRPNTQTMEILAIDVLE
jgi:hypothetical protein